MSRVSNSSQPTQSPASTSNPLKRLLLTFTVLTLGYIVLLAYLHYQSRIKVARVFGGPNSVAILKNADRVEAYRLGHVARDFGDRLPPFSEYPIQAGPVTVSPADTQTLVDTLLDEQSYGWTLRKACIPRPGVRIDFIRGNDRLSLLLCYECKILLSYLNEEMVGGADFDYAQPVLVRIAHSLFPDDPKIRALTVEKFTPPYSR